MIVYTYMKNKKLITFSDRSLEMIEALKKETGFSATTQIVVRGIEELYSSTFKYGRSPLSDSGPNDSEEALVNKAMVKAKAKKALADAQEKIKLAPKVNICENILGGEVKKDELGYSYCHFKTFHTDESKDAEQVIPLRQCDPVLAETSLFTPSREAVFKARKDIKKLFETQE